MNKLFKSLLFLGLMVGTAVAVRNYFEGSESRGEETVQVTFDDGSTQSFGPGTMEAQEFTDIARKIVEAGL